MPVLDRNDKEKKAVIGQLNEQFVNGYVGPKVHFEQRKIERQTSHFSRSTEKTKTTRRNSGTPNYYQEGYFEMENPLTTMPMLEKLHLTQIRGDDGKNESGSTSYIETRHFVRPEGSSQCYSIADGEWKGKTYQSTDISAENESLRGFEQPNRSIPSEGKVEKKVTIGGEIQHEPCEPFMEQEYYPYRDSRHGKPLPGDNGFLSNLLTSGDNRKVESYFHYTKSESPSPTLNKTSSGQSTRWTSKSSSGIQSSSVSPAPRSSQSSMLTSPSTSRSSSQLSSHSHRVNSTATSSSNEMNKEKRGYRGYEVHVSSIPEEYFTQLRHIKVTSIPTPIPPKFGTLIQGESWPNEAKGPVDIGPLCELCKSPITETRLMNHENLVYHCWHFSCSHCCKTLQQDDFRIANTNKPYCLNCFKRQSFF